jgi:transcription elongation factor GreA
VISLEPDDRRFLVTPEGQERLRKELDALTTVRRSEVAERLRQARDGGGDLADNWDLLDALEDQALLERRISSLESRLALARVVDGGRPDGAVSIGTRVRLRDLDYGDSLAYDLVGALETDLGEEKLSMDSPVGRALMGRRAGDVIEVNAPRGTVRFEIQAVDS